VIVSGLGLKFVATKLCVVPRLVESPATRKDKPVVNEAFAGGPAGAVSLEP
jgi:hypothetical protein